MLGSGWGYRMYYTKQCPSVVSEKSSLDYKKNAMSSSYKQGWDAQFLITQFFSYSVTQNLCGKHVFMMCAVVWLYQFVIFCW